MFTFQISFLLPGSTALQTATVTAATPWDAANQVRAQHGNEIKVLQTCCL